MQVSKRLLLPQNSAKQAYTIINYQNNKHFMNKVLSLVLSVQIINYLIKYFANSVKRQLKFLNASLSSRHPPLLLQESPRILVLGLW